MAYHNDSYNENCARDVSEPCHAMDEWFYIKDESNNVCQIPKNEKNNKN